jgi:hypothetical protein
MNNLQLFLIAILCFTLYTQYTEKYVAPAQTQVLAVDLTQFIALYSQPENFEQIVPNPGFTAPNVPSADQTTALLAESQPRVLNSVSASDDLMRAQNEGTLMTIQSLSQEYQSKL